MFCTKYLMLTKAIYLIKNTAETEILWNIIIITTVCFKKIMSIKIYIDYGYYNYFIVTIVYCCYI